MHATVCIRVKYNVTVTATAPGLSEIMHNPIRPTRRLLVVGLFFACSPAFADDHFLIVGGGPNPFNNQVSLESNVLFARRVLDDAGSEAASVRTFFSDGKIDKPDLQFLDPELEHDPAVLWMSCIFGDETAVNYRYRDHRVRPVNGPTRKGFLKQAFFELAERLGEDDRLIVYVTAHGGAAETSSYYGEYDFESDGDPGDYFGSDSEEDNAYDTTIALWGDDSLTVSELDLWLNKFSAKVRVVLIMAQCHSGGFAHSIFHDADEDHGLNPQLRAGFFSQRHDRAAAGCTPDIDESNYQEYSTYFWEAIGGMTRAGEPVDPPDFDSDGEVSFNEAHAHAIISCDSIDIPLTTTDAFLRKYSQIAPIDEETEDDANKGSLLSSLFGGSAEAADNNEAPDEIEKPLARNQSITHTQKRARPEQREVIATLSKEMKFKPSDTVEKVRRRAARLEEAADNASQLWGTAVALAEKERQSLAGMLSVEWPALRSRRYSPRMEALTGKEGSSFVDTVTSQPQCDSYLQAKQRAMDLEKKMSEAQHREARMRRLLRTLENVLLEHNLPHHASEARLKHFNQLMALQDEGI